MLRKVDEARATLVTGNSDAAYNEALNTIAAADAADSIANLYAEARRTPTSADEAIVGRIEGIEQNIAKTETEIAGLRRGSPRTVASALRNGTRARAVSSHGLRSPTQHLQQRRRHRQSFEKVCCRAPFAVARFGTSCRMGTDRDPPAAARILADPIFPCRFPFRRQYETIRPAAAGAIRLVAAGGHQGHRNPPPTTRTSQRADPSNSLDATAAPRVLLFMEICAYAPARMAQARRQMPCAAPIVAGPQNGALQGNETAPPALPTAMPPGIGRRSAARR